MQKFFKFWGATDDESWMCHSILGDEQQRLRRIWHRGLRAGLGKLSNIVELACKQVNSNLSAEKEIDYFGGSQNFLR